MESLWSIPTVGLYFYVATVLTDYGFLSYFNVPSNFVQASLSANIIFSYQYITTYLTLLSEMHWYALAGIGILIFIMGALYYAVFLYKKQRRKILITILTILWLLYLGTFFHLGNIIAANQTSSIVPTNCSIGQDYAYVVPVMDGNQTVLIPIDRNNKITGGFLIKNTSDLPCLFEWKEIGKITH